MTPLRIVPNTAAPMTWVPLTGDTMRAERILGRMRLQAVTTYPIRRREARRARADTAAARSERIR